MADDSKSASSAASAGPSSKPLRKKDTVKARGAKNGVYSVDALRAKRVRKALGIKKTIDKEAKRRLLKPIKDDDDDEPVVEYYVKWTDHEEDKCTWIREDWVYDPDQITELSEVKSWVWQYYSENPQDGKPAGWHDCSDKIQTDVEPEYLKYLSDAPDAKTSVQVTVTHKIAGKDVTYTYTIWFEPTLRQRNDTHPSHTERMLRRVPKT